jgi:para-aminobenzoate synthetase component 1
VIEVRHSSSFLTLRAEAIAFHDFMIGSTGYQTTASITSFMENIFAAAAAEPGAVWLDSSLVGHKRSQYSMIARRPCTTYTYRGGSISVTEGATITHTHGDLTRFFNQVEAAVRQDNLVAAGYVSYEAALPFVGLSGPPTGSGFPDAIFFLYDSVLYRDHLTGTLRLSDPTIDSFQALRPESVSSLRKSPERDAELCAQMPYREYAERIEAIKEHIALGNIYQANFTCRFDVRHHAFPFEVYRRLRRLNPAPYSAYLNCGDFQILSSSPELMFDRRGSHIETSPIKGTIERGRCNSEDMANTQRLMNSEKDRAELLMIVDLERNDLGKIGRYGSVRVNSLFNPETYSSLIHLVASISAEIPADLPLGEVCKALLPGGSVTGAPKRRAIEILRECEDVPRFVYTGNVGVISRDQSTFNIAIRTLVHQNGMFFAHSGGGIVADSEPGAEYREMQLKAKNLLKALPVGNG